MNNTIRVNNQEINLVSHKGEVYVAIKPICDAIGIAFQRQLAKIKEDEILSSVVTLRVTTGTDGKQYEMQTLPLRYVFGWLFTISPKNVKPEIKDSVTAYRMECYNALFDTFTKRSAILREKTAYQTEIERLENELKKDNKYIRIQELKQSVSGVTKRLNRLDKEVVNEQLDLFEESEA